MNPIIADADTGHGGLTATMKLAKMFIENGAAGIHIEDGRGPCSNHPTPYRAPVCSFRETVRSAGLQV